MVSATEFGRYIFQATWKRDQKIFKSCHERHINYIAQFSLYVQKDGLSPHSFIIYYFIAVQIDWKT